MSEAMAKTEEQNTRIKKQFLLKQMKQNIPYHPPKL